MDSSVLREALARLVSLRQNLPEQPLAVRYVNEFHEIVDLLARATGGDLRRLRIAATELQPVVVAESYIGDPTEYSRESYCDYALFRMRVDALLMMFEMETGSRPSPIGFKPSPQ